MWEAEDAKILYEIAEATSRIADALEGKLQHNEPEPDGELKCRHLSRRVTGTRLECADCGAVIEDEGASALNSASAIIAASDMPAMQRFEEMTAREAALKDQLEHTDQLCRYLEGKIVKLNKMRESLRLAVNANCTCGGAGPGEGCPACEVWHDFLKAQQDKAQVVGDDNSD